VSEDIFCDICLNKTHVSEYDDSLQVCSECLYAINTLKEEKSFSAKLSKEQIAGGIKDEL